MPPARVVMAGVCQRSSDTFTLSGGLWEACLPVRAALRLALPAGVGLALVSAGF